MEPEVLNSWSENLIIPELRVLVLTKRHVGSGNEIVQLGYDRAEKRLRMSSIRAGKPWQHISEMVFSSDKT